MKRAIIWIMTLCVISTPAVFAESLEDAARLNGRVIELSQQGRYADAIPFAERSLAVREKALGPNHPEVAESLNNLGYLYSVLANYEKTEPLYRRSLAIREKALGPDHQDVAASLNNLAWLYFTLGDYPKAEPLYRRALAIKEKALGPDHPDVALSLQNMAALYNKHGDYAKAERNSKRALAIREKTLGPDHPDVAQSLNDLGCFYRTLGDFIKADPLLKRALAVREKALGQYHPDVAQSLNDLAGLFDSMGHYMEAEPLYKRALAIYEKALGPNHPSVAASLNNLAFLYSMLGNYAKADPLLKRSLSIYEKILGPEHPDVAVSLHNLAELYKTLGDYAGAEPLYRRALAIQEKALGTDHPDVASSLNGLAALYGILGDYEKAELLYKRALAIQEKTLGEDHLAVALSRNNLAALYDRLHDYAKAEQLYQRSLAVYEKTFGPDHPDVALNLNNLAALYHGSGNHAKAEPLYERALAIREKSLGKDHPDVALNLNNMAILNESSGDYAKAESLLKRSLAIYEKVLGADSPEAAVNLNNLAVLYGKTERYAEGRRHFVRATAINDKTRENVFLVLSERQKLNYMKQTSINLYRFISLTSRHMPSDPEAVNHSFNAWIRWKGAVMEAQGRYLDAVTYSDDPRISEKFAELTNLRREIARLQLSKPEKLNFEQYRKMLDDHGLRKEALESELSRLSRDFNLEKMAGKADIARLSSILPKDSSYLDYARINVYDFQQKKFIGDHYLLFVLTPGQKQPVHLINLGKAEDVDRHITLFLREMNRPKTEGRLPHWEILKSEGRAVYDLVLKPVESLIRDRKLFISPDGNLNLIPFEVLLDGRGKYLLENHDIGYVGAGRDIVKFTDQNAQNGSALIMADPDYDVGLQEKEKIAGQMGITETKIRGIISRDAVGMHFDRLPETKPEADAIASVLKDRFHPNVENYQDKKALEEILFKVRNPWILHLATHGYFLKAEEVRQDENLGGGRMPQKESRVFSQGPALAGIENPMLRSGIVLAGVNASLREGRDDGMVSAEKILGLRLKGTDLVVLSACETGVGDVQSGEGVFGLKRSFILSGAKTVVMSLWSVPSRETTELMTDFYTRMSRGDSKSAALKHAKLGLMKKSPNPFFWGAFVMVGAQ